MVRMIRETILRLKCNDCDFQAEFTLDPGEVPIDLGADTAWDHLGKYDEVLSDHVVEATVVYRYYNEVT